MKFTEQKEAEKPRPTFDDVPIGSIFQHNSGIYVKCHQNTAFVLKKASNSYELVGDTIDSFNCSTPITIEAWYDEVILTGAHR